MAVKHKVAFVFEFFKYQCLAYRVYTAISVDLLKNNLNVN